MKKIAAFAFVFITCAFLLQMMVAEFHGYFAEVNDGKLHADCFLCELYKIGNMNNAAFQVRELGRK